MSETPNQVNRRLTLRIVHLEEQIEAEQAERVKEKRILDHKLAVCQAAQRGKDTTIFMLEQTIQSERILRVAAQRKLRDDILTPCFECGKPWRPPHQRVIGYDPDEDVIVQKDIAEGRIEPLQTAR